MKSKVAILVFTVVALLAVSCQKAQPTDLTVDFLKVIVSGQKDDNGWYRVSIKEDGKEESDTYISIKSIERFDAIYQLGREYRLLIKRAISDNGIRYIWTGEYWSH
ncbi:MAG: hypothetical protein Q4E10_02210 [Porphyromonas sp.]|nr:hypothetical protein [Porphyromonas sp.]